MSIKKIAQMTGVSPATVSRVLNNPAYKCSSEQMREKIWKAAMELNYVPNEAARNLKLGTHSKEKTCYLDILMTRVDASRTDSFFYELLRIIESEIHKQMGILTKVWYLPIFSDDKKCARENLDIRPSYVVETRQTEAEGFEAMKHFLQSEDAPTAFYCANDITAVGMLKCMNTYKNRYYTPSIISSDDIEEAQNISPMLTTVHLPKEEMGKFALFLILDRIRGGHKTVTKIELESRLMIRDSCSAIDMGWCDFCI